jgi:prepilin-type N-terminal cleavage/methylation domain-containing protein
MRKNGFTLIELLGVIVILAMLGVIIVPTINKVITDNKNELYEVQIRNIKSGVSNFVSENIFSDGLSIPNNSSIGIKLGKLKELGYIDSDITNPITKNKFSDDLVILITNKDNGYSYTVCDERVNCNTNVRMYGE